MFPQSWKSIRYNNAFCDCSFRVSAVLYKHADQAYPCLETCTMHLAIPQLEVVLLSYIYVHMVESSKTP